MQALWASRVPAQRARGFLLPHSMLPLPHSLLPGWHRLFYSQYLLFGAPLLISSSSLPYNPSLSWRKLCGWLTPMQPYPPLPAPLLAAASGWLTAGLPLRHPLPPGWHPLFHTLLLHGQGLPEIPSSLPLCSLSLPCRMPTGWLRLKLPCLPQLRHFDRLFPTTGYRWLYYLTFCSACAPLFPDTDR